MKAPDFLQTKERMLRKRFHSKSISGLGLIQDVREYSSASERSEMENRFKTKIMPSNYLENVIIQQAIPKIGVPQSSRARLMSGAILNDEKSDPKMQPFYYINRNEMLDFEEFFQFHKNLETNRRNNDKLRFEEQMEEKRLRLKEFKANSTHNRASSSSARLKISTSTQRVPLKISSLNHSISTRAQSGNFGLRGRSYSGVTLFESSSARPSAKDIAILPQIEVEARNFEEDASQQRPSVEKIYKADSRPNESENSSPINLELHGYTLPGRNTTRSSSHAQRALTKTHSPFAIERAQSAQLKSRHNERAATPEKELILPPNTSFFEPKLRGKEIYKQLLYYTVTPKKLKSKPHEVRREKHYITVFKNARVMDREMGLTLQKIRKQKFKESQVQAPVKQLRSLSVIGQKEEALRTATEEVSEPVQSLLNLDQLPHSSRVLDHQKNDIIAETITRTIQDINDMLKENLTIIKSKSVKGTPIQSVKSSPKGPGKTNLKQLLANRRPLRKVVEEKYGTLTVIKRNVELSQRVKEIKSLVVKQSKEADKVAHYPTADFVDYYIT